MFGLGTLTKIIPNSLACSTFMFAGHDTTSSALSRILHNLAVHSDVQEKLRQEIASSGILQGDVSFDDLMALPYLDAVCKETLRVSVHLESILPLES